MNKKDDLTIVVCSCDKNEDVWDLYFKIFDRQWANCKYPIVLNTESKNYENDYGVKTLNLYSSDENPDWSSRMIKTLQSIESEYVLITLEDHFLCDKVDTERFDELLERMKRDKKISCVSFEYRQFKNKHPKRFMCFERSSVNRIFRINLDTSLWRKDKMLKYLKEGENPWEFELNGTERAIWDFSGYYYTYDSENFVIKYYANDIRKGYGIFGGKWNWRMPELAQEYGYKIDTEKRPLYTYEEIDEYLNKNLYANKQEADREAKKDASFFGQFKRRIPKKLLLWLVRVKHAIIKK